MSTTTPILMPTLQQNIANDATLSHLLIGQALASKYIGWDIHKVSELPSIRSYDELVFGGGFSYTFPQRQMKAIVEDYAVRIVDIDATPSAIAREYLKMHYPAKRRAFNLQRVAILQPRKAPGFVDPGVYPDMVYADVVSAYWSIMKLVGWDVDYYPENFVLAGRAPLDFPFPDNKLARNCLLSSAMLTTVEIWKNRSWSYHRRGSSLINYSLVALVMDVLNALAWDALECGAVYVATDGYIIPRDNLGKLSDRVTSYGLSLRTKYTGDAEITSIGGYRVGAYTSKPFTMRHDARPLTNLQRVNRAFLRKELSFIADRKLATEVYALRKVCYTTD